VTHPRRIPGLTYDEAILKVPPRPSFFPGCFSGSVRDICQRSFLSSRDDCPSKKKKKKKTREGAVGFFFFFLGFVFCFFCFDLP